MKAVLLANLLAMALASDAAPLPTKELIAIATRHQVPMPPAEARLVLAHSETWAVLGNQSTSRDPGIYSPAFLREEKPGRIVILRGMEKQTLQDRHFNEPFWRPFSAEKVKPKLGGHAVDFANVSTFVCAVQSAARGDETHAQAIWKRFAAEEWWQSDGFRESFQEERDNPPLLLASCIFNHLRRRLLQNVRDWPEVQTRMKALLAEFPKLKTTDRTSLFDDLTLTVNAKPPASNSIEALMLTWAGTPDTSRQSRLFDEKAASAGDSAARQIVLRGRAAVPDLIALLKDRRITAHEASAIMNSAARVQRLGELSQALLQEITGIDGWPEAAAFQEWLEKSQALGEDAALAASVFERDGDKKIKSVKEAPARILAQRFPEKLLPLCEEFSKDALADTQPFALAKAVANAGLPKETRVKALSEFAQRGSLAHKRSVLQELAKLDDKKCAELLLPILQKLSPDSPGPYWTCPEAAFTHVVMLVEDDDIWREYLQAAKRSSVGLRMQMMNPLCYAYIGTKNRERRLAFVAAFLDDEALRDTSIRADKYAGPCAAFTIPRITVRDFAAEKIAGILGLPVEPDEFWTAAQWEELRKKVRSQLATENLPDLGIVK